MNLDALLENLSNPALLFFIFGIIASQIKSDLSIPENSSKFISIYLLISIGFKGGQELSHTAIDSSVVLALIGGALFSAIVPIYTFFLLKRKLKLENAVAIAASYGSVSAVTFVTAISFLEMEGIHFGGHMIAVMAIMEAPAIIVGVYFLNSYRSDAAEKTSNIGVLRHSFTNASVMLILGSLIIGFLASETQAEGIKPFTTDIFKGFLAVFLLDMGIKSGKHLGVLCKKGIFPFLFSSIIPFVNGLIAVSVGSLFMDSFGNLLLFSILVASASYIAVPAAMRNIAPSSDPGLYLPMALGITFPINVMIGIPFYASIIPYFLN